ncbi:MAG: T9SS type A sorting domain-containing protein [Ignavibacteriae bacterium]|nr:T9SS type A sorting domain-containing protein [Ignavibacteria bacterium]MBI3364942.1 T9SS type A sorting domain-containing protein [Ignavibacteriota bacterium]
MKHCSPSVTILFAVILLYLSGETLQGQIKKEYTPFNAPVGPDPGIAWRRGYFEGYTQSPSVKQGDTVKFSLSTLAAFTPPSTVTTVSCAMKIYRAIGRFMTGDTLMTTETSFTGTFYPLHDAVGGTIYPGDTSRFPYEYRRGCNWPVAVSYGVPATWPSGFYYAKIYKQGFESDSVGYVPFVVRASSPGTSKKILCVIPWNTYHAYNYWGGGSLYWWMGTFDSPDRWSNGGKLVRVVSFRRPFANFTWAYGEVTSNLGQYNHRERAFIAWAERNGYSLEYCIDSDLNNADGTGFLNIYKTAVFPGHSEYWTRPERRNIENQQTGFKSKNGNFSFFAANNCFWMVDYSPSLPSTNNPDSMYCDKENDNYFWRKQAEGGEAKFVGIQFQGNNDPGPPSRANIVQKAVHWIFKSTGLGNGARFGLGLYNDNPSLNVDSLALGEADMMRTGVSPSNTELLGRVFIRTKANGDPDYNTVDSIYSDVAYYEDTTTNSRVFAPGGMGWDRCLFGQDSSVMRTMSSNILDHFSLRKYIGKIYTIVQWDGNIELDGNVYLLAGKTLTLNNTMTLTIDANDTLFIDGTLQINSNITIKGSGVLKVNPTGKINTNPNTILTVGSGVTLLAQPGSVFKFGNVSSLADSGKLIAVGTSSQRIIFTSTNTSPAPGNWSGIRLFGGPNTLSYCTIKYAVDGITINSNAGTTLQSDSIKQCDNAGVNEVNSPGYGALSVQSSYLQNNFYGLVNHNSWAEVKSSTVISNNSWDGIDMYGGAYMYIDHTNIQNNSCFGIFATGLATAGYLAADGTGGGYNTVTGNGCTQIYLDSSAAIFIGDKYQTCDCIEAPIGIDIGKKKYDPSVRAVSSLGCDPPCTLNWHQQGGYNTINGIYYWVENRTTSGVYADLTCWGITPPPASAFYGTVYRDYPLTTGCSGGMAIPSIVRASNGGTEMTGDTDGIPLNPTGVATLQEASQEVKVAVRHALSLIQDNPDSAEYAVPMLMGFVGPIGKYANLLASPWDSLLQDVERNSSSNLLRLQATVYRIQTYQVHGEYARAIALARAVLSRIPNDELWLYCQEQIIFANVSQSDLNTAANIFSSMQARGMRISPRAVTHLGKFLLMKGANVSLTGAAGLVKSGLQSSSVAPKYQLLQNYPNPFNPVTVIRYSLLNDAPVVLRVFNPLGQEVKTLVREFQVAGSHEVTFDAHDLSSGVYYYHLQAGSFSEVRKLLLVK